MGPPVGKKPFSLQRHGSACDLGTTSECFQGVAERLGTSLKPFEGLVCGARVKSLEQSLTRDADHERSTTMTVTAKSPFVEKDGERTNFVTFLRLISERVRSMDVAWERLRDSDLKFRPVGGPTHGTSYKRRGQKMNHTLRGIEMDEMEYECLKRCFGALEASFSVLQRLGSSEV
ncbi:hypothetical protein C8J57DRAFT_1239743 [Mycena rebaudengoi]|nr:hypothetical protein C8J57DRAFT_1239743 [Mycena rebaudengoi]